MYYSVFVLSGTNLFYLIILAFSLDAEQPDYDLDSEDEIFVNKLRKKLDISLLQFEEMIDRLEKGSGQQVHLMLCFFILFYLFWTARSLCLLSSFKANFGA